MLNNEEELHFTGSKTQYLSFKDSIQSQIKSPYENQECNKKSKSNSNQSEVQRLLQSPNIQKFALLRYEDI